ncbi:unnamed protein product [Durusdinium trenchii]
MDSKKDEEERPLRGRICCSCAESERSKQWKVRAPTLRDFVEMKIQVEQYEGTLLHYACGADSEINISQLTCSHGCPSLARRLLAAKAANCPDNRGQTPLGQAVAGNHLKIAWDICEYGIDNDVQDIIADIEEQLQKTAKEYTSFLVCVDWTKVVQENWFDNLNLWLKLPHGAQLCLTAAGQMDILGGGVPQAPPPWAVLPPWSGDPPQAAPPFSQQAPPPFPQLPGASLPSWVPLMEKQLEFKLPSDWSPSVAPIACKLDLGLNFLQSDRLSNLGLQVRARGAKESSAESEAKKELARIERTQRVEGGNETEALPEVICKRMPFKEWVRTEEMRCKEALMNNDSGGDHQTLWHLACKKKNIRLAKILRAQDAEYKFANGRTPLDMVLDASLSLHDDEAEVMDVISHDGRWKQGAPSVTGGKPVMDPKLRELAELLIFDDYQTYLQEKLVDLAVVQRYARDFALMPSAMVLMRSTDGKTLLHWAAIYGNHIDVEWLLSSGAQLLALDQLVFQDLRLTILKPKKQELGEIEEIRPKFFWQKNERALSTILPSSVLQDMPSWVRLQQESVSEWLTQDMSFQRAESFDCFQWPETLHERSIASWVLEARVIQKDLSPKEEWVILNLQLEGLELKDNDESEEEKSGTLATHTNRTPLDYALQFAPSVWEGHMDDTPNKQLSPHAKVCKLLLERALMAEKQQDARGGSLLKHALRSYVRPYVRCRTLPKDVIDLHIGEQDDTAEKNTLLHVAAKLGLVNVCSELVRRRCAFKEIAEQNPLDVAGGKAHEVLILPAFLAICGKISTLNPPRDEEAVTQCIIAVDEEAKSSLEGLKSRDFTFQQIMNIKNPHDQGHGILEYAAMYGLDRVLQYIIKNYEMEDTRPTRWPADLIATALPRYPNRQKLVDKIRSDFSKADETWGVFHSKQHLKELYDQLAGLDEEGTLKQVQQENFYRDNLHHAASIDTPEAKFLVELMLKNNPNEVMKMKDASGNTALHMAARYNNLEVVQLLCEQYNANKEEKNMHQWKPLHLAAMHQSFESMKYLLESSAQPISMTSDKETPLHLIAKHFTVPQNVRSLEHNAEQKQFHQIMDILIDKICAADRNPKQFINNQDSSGKTALEYLAGGSPAFVCHPMQRLVREFPHPDSFANVLDSVTSTMGRTPILKALLESTPLMDTEEEDPATISLLRQLVESNGNDDLTALQRCATNGNLDAARVILEKLISLPLLKQALLPGFNFSALNDINLPLHLAMQNKHEEVAKLLASRMLVILEPEDLKALQWRNFFCADASRKFREDMESIFTRDDSLLEAVKAGDRTAVEAILKKRATLAEESIDDQGNTPLHFAVQNRTNRQQKDIVLLLLENRGTMVPNHKGETPLHLLCSRAASLTHKPQDEAVAHERWYHRWKRPHWEDEEDEEGKDERELGSLIQMTDFILKTLVTTHLTDSDFNTRETLADGKSPLEQVLAYKTTDGDTAFDLLCGGLENAAFGDETHRLRKFLKLAWLRPLKSRGDFLIPAREKLTLLGLAVLMQSREAAELVKKGDPLAGSPDENAFTYALLSRRYDLVRQMLQRLQDTQGAQEEKLQQAMGSHTIHLLFRDEDYNEELLENIIEILHADDVAQFLQRDRVLERCWARGSERLFEALGSKLGQAACEDSDWINWRFGEKAWTLVHVFVSLGKLEALNDLLSDSALDHSKLVKVLNTEDNHGNTPMHRLLHFLGCVFVKIAGEPNFQGCYFPVEEYGRLSFKKFGVHILDVEEENLPGPPCPCCIRVREQENKRFWVLENDDWERPFAAQLEARPEISMDELPTGSSWERYHSASSEKPRLEVFKSPLFAAEKIVHVLIEFRADITKQNCRGRTPLQECLRCPVTKSLQPMLAKLSLSLMGVGASMDSHSDIGQVKTLLVELRDSDGLNALEAASNISWFEAVWNEWLETLLPMGVFSDIGAPVDAVLEQWRLPPVRRQQTVPRLVATLVADESLKPEVVERMSMPQAGLSSFLTTCLSKECCTLLQNLKHTVELKKIWLVHEPVDVTKPLASLSLSTSDRKNITELEVDFMEATENESGAVDVRVGVYGRPHLGKATTQLFLNGVAGAHQTAPQTLQLLEPSYWALGGLDRCKVWRTVGFKGMQASGKFYYEVELVCNIQSGRLFLGWATEDFTSFAWKADTFFGINSQLEPADAEDEWEPEEDEEESEWTDQSCKLGDVFGMAVDLDQKTAWFSLNGKRFLEYPVHGDRKIFPILRTSGTVRIKLRPCDWQFAPPSKFRSWLEDGELLRPDQRHIFNFTNVPKDQQCCFRLKLELRAEIDGMPSLSKVFKARSLISTAIWKQCKWKIIDILKDRGCELTLETLVSSLRWVRRGTKVLRMHQSLSSDPRYASVLLGPNKDKLQPWVFGAFLEYLKNGDLDEEDVMLVCHTFAACGAPLQRMRGDYIDAKDVSVQVKGTLHQLDGIYVRRDDFSSERQCFVNLCRPGQWIVNDPAESFWKIGLTDILEEGQPPWYVKLANLEDGKIRVVVDGIEQKSDLRSQTKKNLEGAVRAAEMGTMTATSALSSSPSGLISTSHRGHIQRSPRPKGQKPRLKHVQDRYLTNCFKELQEPLQISDESAAVFWRELGREVGQVAEAWDEEEQRKMMQFTAALRESLEYDPDEELDPGQIRPVTMMDVEQ